MQKDYEPEIDILESTNRFKTLLEEYIVSDSELTEKAKKLKYKLIKFCKNELNITRK